MSNNKKVLLLSKYSRLGASSRIRSYQFIPYLEANGVCVEVAPLFNDNYVIGLYAGSMPWPSIIWGYLSRIRSLLKAQKFDLIWMEKEALPWLPAFIEMAMMRSDVPLLIEYDDAVFHRYDQSTYAVIRWLLGRKIDCLMSWANLVVAGNDYLVSHAVRAGARSVEKLPTVVDLKRYSVVTEQALERRPLTIGWIGTPGTSHYLLPLVPVLKALVSRLKVTVVAIGAGDLPEFGNTIQIVPWAEELEVQSIQAIDIGIMPLPDEPFERGKCGYKLIQYMACSKPVIASPVGENVRIVNHGEDGFLASTPDEWRVALETLCQDSGLRTAFGSSGRKHIETHYSLAVAEPRQLNIIRKAMNDCPTY